MVATGVPPAVEGGSLPPGSAPKFKAVWQGQRAIRPRASRVDKSRKTFPTVQLHAHDQATPVPETDSRHGAPRIRRRSGLELPGSSAKDGYQRQPAQAAGGHRHVGISPGCCGITQPVNSRTGTSSNSRASSAPGWAPSRATVSTARRTSPIRSLPASGTTLPGTSA